MALPRDRHEAELPIGPVEALEERLAPGRGLRLRPLGEQDGVEVREVLIGAAPRPHAGGQEIPEPRDRTIGERADGDLHAIGPAPRRVLCAPHHEQREPDEEAAAGAQGEENKDKKASEQSV